MGDRNFIVRAPHSLKIQRITVSSTGATTALLTTLAGLGWVRVKAITANVQFFFTTDSGASVVLDAADGATCGWTLLAGQSEDYELTNETHIAWDADGTGQIMLCRAGGERGGR